LLKRLSPQEAFSSSNLNENLAQKSVSGGISTLGSQSVQFVLRIASVAILARLLTPKDYGIIGMVTVVVNFAMMFKDAGLSIATVQKERITHDQISTLFWINIIISAILGLCVLASAPWVSLFYGTPELTEITVALSFSFILSGLTIQHQALQRRHMRFGTLAIIQVSSQIITLIVTICLALFGWRYWALVVGTLTHALTGSVLTFLFCPWIPGRMKKGTGVREMLKFGSHVTGFNFINYFSRNADNILIGKFIGADALGIYNRAYQLLMLPITMISGPLSNVAVPTLCRLNEDRKRLHKYYLHILYLLSLVAGPIAGIAFLTSKDIVIILLGPQWSLVSDVFKYLAIGALLQPLYNTQAWLHLAVGRSDRGLKWGVIGTPIIVTSFLLGLIWGIKGIAFCYSMAIIVTTIGSLFYAGSSAGLSFCKMLSAVFRPILSCVATVIIITIVTIIIDRQSHMVSLVTKGMGFVALYAICLLLMYNGTKPMNDLVNIGQMLTTRNQEKHL
jgi:PST family polysaccharide transporter